MTLKEMFEVSIATKNSIVVWDGKDSGSILDVITIDYLNVAKNTEKHAYALRQIDKYANAEVEYVTINKVNESLDIDCYI